MKRSFRIGIALGVALGPLAVASAAGASTVAAVGYNCNVVLTGAAPKATGVDYGASYRLSCGATLGAKILQDGFEGTGFVRVIFDEGRYTGEVSFGSNLPPVYNGTAGAKFLVAGLTFRASRKAEVVHGFALSPIYFDKNTDPNNTYYPDGDYGVSVDKWLNGMVGESGSIESFRL